jgi:hypothetical protein
VVGIVVKYVTAGGLALALVAVGRAQAGGRLVRRPATSGALTPGEQLEAELCRLRRRAAAERCVTRP